MNLYQVYLITNQINNKKYVGQVIKKRGYKKRFLQHLQNKKVTLLTSAIKCYGKEAFHVELLEDNVPETLIDEREIYYIKLFGTYYAGGDGGYNMTAGGQGTHKYILTEADKKKISEASKRTWQQWRNNPEKLKQRNERLSASQKGRVVTESCKQTLREKALKRFENTPGTMYGKKHTPEALVKIKQSAMKRAHPVIMLDKDTEEPLRTFASVAEASDYVIAQKITTNKHAFTRIILICNNTPGQGKTAYGYKWKYADGECIDYPAGE